MSDENNRPIGVFDSGIGGVSILKELQNKLPKESFIYLADGAFFPYGDKRPKQIQSRVLDIAKWFKKQDIKLLVVACNTATVMALEELRKANGELPAVGTVPVIKTCAQQTKNGNIGILTTARTARSVYQDKLIRQFAPDKNVFVQAAPGLVEKIEKGDAVAGHVSKNINNLLSKNVDSIALGCSHFPLVKKEVSRAAGGSAFVLDSGAAIARQAQRVLRAEGLLAPKKTKTETLFYTTGKTQKFDIILSKYVGVKARSERATI